MISQSCHPKCNGRGLKSDSEENMSLTAVGEGSALGRLF